MKTTFLGQGFNPKIDNSIGNKIMEFFSENNFQTFTGISAFASEAGVNGLASCISSSTSFENINLIVGIDQEGTSKETLEEILNLKVNSYIFYQSEKPIFHPKIYLFEGNDKTAIIIGSSNLTARGLFNNIESSILIEFENNEAEGIQLLSEIKTYYSTLFDFKDPNLFKITQEAINYFVDSEIVPLKRIWLKKQGKKKVTQPKEGQVFEVPKRAVAEFPKYFSSKSKLKDLIQTFEEETTAVDDSKSILEEKPIAIRDTLQEVWKSGPLSERDLNIPTGSKKTNLTGSMSFNQGLFKNIDQKHYFRENVFNSLDWKKSTRRGSEHLDKGNATFKIKIDGQEKGDFSLIVTHNPKIDTKTYRQGNSPTGISWGNAKNLIRNRELLGKTLTLFKDTTSNDKYTILIE